MGEQEQSPGAELPVETVTRTGGPESTVLYTWRIEFFDESTRLVVGSVETARLPHRERIETGPRYIKLRITLVRDEISEMGITGTWTAQASPDLLLLPQFFTNENGVIDISCPVPEKQKDHISERLYHRVK